MFLRNMGGLKRMLIESVPFHFPVVSWEGESMISGKHTCSIWIYKAYIWRYSLQMRNKDGTLSSKYQNYYLSGFSQHSSSWRSSGVRIISSVCYCHEEQKAGRRENCAPVAKHFYINQSNYFICHRKHEERCRKTLGIHRVPVLPCR